MANCHKCGSPLKSNKQFCSRCGAKVETIAAAPQSLPQPQASAQVQCSKCGATVPAGKRFCTLCGATLTPTRQAQTIAGVACPKCGATVPTGKRFCTRCGHTLRPSAQRQAGLSASSISQIPSTQQPAADVKCAKCGAAVPAGKRFCTTCGNPIEAPVEVLQPSPPPPSPPLIEVTPIQAKSIEVKPEEKPATVKPPDRKIAPARRALLRVALPIAAAVVVAAGLFSIYTLIIRKPGTLNDKQLLEAYYGPPPFFTVIIAKDESQQPPKPVRREVWIYPEKRVSFVFLGGKYQFSSDLKSVGKTVAKAAGKLRIEQITESLTADDLSKLLGSKPVSQVNLPKEELPDAIRYEYGNGISAVFSQGRLLMVQFRPAQEGK
jgi:predicted amidophosphoribosyltransferase